ncbi:MAG: hypothetical protein KKH44_07680 [Bacteroidetes bacterium]|nr:hypothetical protein [Bacteroidota bacterium]
MKYTKQIIDKLLESKMTDNDFINQLRGLALLAKDESNAGGNAGYASPSSQGVQNGGGISIRLAKQRDAGSCYACIDLETEDIIVIRHGTTEVRYCKNCAAELIKKLAVDFFTDEYPQADGTVADALEPYHYNVTDSGTCTEKCNVRIGIRIGSCSCRECEDNLSGEEEKDYIICKKIKEATATL